MRFLTVLLGAVALQVVLATNVSKNRLSNPLFGRRFYLNPTFQQNIQTSVNTAKPGLERNSLAFIRDVPTAYWLDIKEKVGAGNDSTTETAEGILKHATQQVPPPLVTFVVYNLPNRDCGAEASNGEICCSANLHKNGTCNYYDHSDDCTHGLNDYKHNYIDPIAQSVRKYCNRIPMALIIEPDSLPNLVTNLENPRCGGRATRASYTKGIPYAVRTLAAACPSATIYVDAAHGNWIGWADNTVKFANLFRGLGIAPLIRGFSLNVANYKLLGKRCPTVGFCLLKGNSKHPCCQEDTCGLIANGNPAHTELNYAMALRTTMERTVPDFYPHMVIDTSRNGIPTIDVCSTWCNVRGAGSGAYPTTNCAYPEVVDAYMWIKTPGESDGCTELLPGGSRCKRFDVACAATGSIGSRRGEPRSPGAGNWFDFQIKMLARNAKIVK